KSYWEKYQLVFTVGEEIDIQKDLLSLIDMGYERVPMVNTPGEFSQRGGIIDIYPVTEEHTIRLELFDDEVDSIRYFDAGSQRSLQKEQTVNIHPATELLLAEDDIISGVQRLEDALGKSLQKLKTPGGKEKLTEVIGYDVERLKNMERFQEMYKYIGFFYENPTSLLDYMPESGVVILDEMSRIQESANHLDTEEAEWYSSLLESNQMVHDSYFSFDWHAIWDNTNHMRIYMSVFLRHI